MPFDPDCDDIHRRERGFPWIPATIAPQNKSTYLVACKSCDGPIIAFYDNPAWYFLSGCEERDGIIVETFDDLDKKPEITHWAHLPKTPE